MQNNTVRQYIFRYQLSTFRTVNTRKLLKLGLRSVNLAINTLPGLLEHATATKVP